MRPSASQGVDDGLDVLGALARHHQQRVRRVDHHHVVQPDDRHDAVTPGDDDTAGVDHPHGGGVAEDPHARDAVGVVEQGTQ